MFVSNSEQRAEAEGAPEPELKQTLGARGGQAAALAQELSVLCREIEETTRAALTSIGAQFAETEADRVAPASADEVSKTTTTTTTTTTEATAKDDVEAETRQ